MSFISFLPTYLKHKIGGLFPDNNNDDETRKERAQEIVNNHILWSMGAGAIPFPVVDVGVLTLVQLSMMKQLCRIYDVDYSRRVSKSLITALVGNALVRVGAIVTKLIPGYGYVVGSISLAILSGASTYALGQVFVNHLDGGNDLFNFDVDQAKEMYDREFERGKEYAGKLKKKYEEQDNPKPVEIDPAPEEKDIFETLNRLHELTEKGILTEEEFLRKKAELLAKI